jgi:hypothetical protein
MITAAKLLLLTTAQPNLVNESNFMKNLLL